ncbi:peroxidase family protein [Verrucomicrobiales bacterium BCK34]|nr:peroxidase family protein [Verrucomicrobiales bacterium BCK34]
MEVKSPSQTALKPTRSTGRSALVAIMLLSLSGNLFAQERKRRSPNDLPKRDKRGAEIQPPNMKKPGTVKMGPRTLVFPDEYRTIDGTNNNIANPEWGAADIPFLRRAAADYSDGISEPSGDDRPNPRTISNEICAQEGTVLNRYRASDFIWQWGQFLDHDITETPTAEPVEEFNVAVPAGDAFFDPQSTGTAEITLDRSYSEVVNGVREQFNEITAYIDASNVYGSNQERADDLRANDGTGMLRTSEGNLLPFNVNALPNAPSPLASNFFIAGDFRANEQVALTALHTVFLREHNYWAKGIAKANPGLTGDQIYEAARAIVGAEMQVITYEEFLPRLLGERALPRYRGYNKGANAGITNAFATASYRFGHTMLSSRLLRLDRRLKEVDEGHLDLASAFFDPTKIINEGGIEPLLRGLAHQPAQEIDTLVVDDVRNFLFGPPGAGGFDLATLNIQRGRDHGLPGFNAVREAYGLDAVDDFDDITPDDELQEKLKEVYGSVDLMDVWVGGLAEKPVRGAMVGATIHAVLVDQFRRLRDGDRFWYQNHLPQEVQRLVEGQTLARIIKRNTEIDRELPEDLWQVERMLEAVQGGVPGGGPKGHRPPPRRR